MKIKTAYITSILTAALALTTTSYVSYDVGYNKGKEEISSSNSIDEDTFDYIIASSPVIEEPEHKELSTIWANEEEIELIALVTMAEAESEPEEGKRLVIDTILNRVDSDRFPDTISDVIYQKNQFTSMWNGRVERCYVLDDIVQLVKEELMSRTDSEVIFFRTDHYSKWGTPMFKVGNHYFSKY